MTNFTEDFVAIQRDFLARGVVTDAPGFYDQPAFMAHERANPKYLNNYARFVHERPRSIEYDAYVRKIAPLVTDVYQEELKRNGRLGACVDISALVSRALEREGIWNFIVKGSLTITFPPASHIGAKYFWSFDTNQFVAAHAWVAAPPFFVLDVAVRLQPYAGKEARYLPRIVCEDGERIVRATVDDIVAPEVQMQLSARGIPTSKQLQYASPETPAFIATFPTRLIDFQGTELKYIPVATTAPDLPFEKMRSMSFDGKSGYEVYANKKKRRYAARMVPNPSLKPTRYGRLCKPGQRQSYYRCVPGLQILPLRAACSNVRHRF